MYWYTRESTSRLDKDVIHMLRTAIEIEKREAKAFRAVLDVPMLLKLSRLPDSGATPISEYIKAEYAEDQGAGVRVCNWVRRMARGGWHTAGSLRRF